MAALLKTGTTTLRVTAVSKDDGHPVEGARVLICRRDVDWDIFEGHTDRQGAFETDCLTPGPFQVTVAAGTEGYARWSQWIDMPRDVGHAEVTFALPRGAVISGRVVTDDGSALPPLRRFRIFLDPVRYEEDDPERLKVGSSISFADKTSGMFWSLSLGEGPQWEQVPADQDGSFVSAPSGPGKMRIETYFPDRDWRYAF